MTDRIIILENIMERIIMDPEAKARLLAQSGAISSPRAQETRQQTIRRRGILGALAAAAAALGFANKEKVGAVLEGAAKGYVKVVDDHVLGPLDREAEAREAAAQATINQMSQRDSKAANTDPTKLQK